MFNDRFAQLMARKLSGEATEAELVELQQFLKDHPQAGYFLEVFTDYWKLQPQKPEDGIQEEIHFQQIIAIAEKRGEESAQVLPEDTMEVRAPLFTLRRLLVAAACIALIAASYYFFAGRPDAPTSEAIALNEVVAQPRARTELRLPDGTKVWLNSESRLEYKGNFNDSVREVSLEGEAYFDVVKDKSRPFIVHTSDIDIRVLGTAFNVKSYPAEPLIEATLIHGLIEVTNKKEPTSPKVILHPHEKLVFNKETATMRDDAATASRRSVPVYNPFAVTALPRNIADTSVVEISWIYNKLVFDGETFRKIASKMERWYDVKIAFESEKVANVPIHVTFKDETIEEALKALQLIEPFQYSIKGNEIEIQRK